MRSTYKRPAFSNLGRASTRFAQDTSGAALVEFAICLPLLLVFLAAAVILQDSIRLGYINEKASYTLGDLTSREDEAIDADYFNRLAFIQNVMVNKRFIDERNTVPLDLRVTTIECTSNCTDEANRVIEVCWSEASPDLSELTTEDFDAFVARTPLFASGDTLIVTESYLDYSPPAFQRFFDDRRFESVTFTRPRVTSQVKYDTGTTDGAGETIFRDCFNNDA